MPTRTSGPEADPPIVLTVNAGSSSLRLDYVREGEVTDSLRRSEPPGSAAADRAVRDFVAAHDPPDAVGHRLVHGGDLVRTPTVLDEALRRSLDRLTTLAPLHLPPALHLLDQIRAELEVPQVLCPDTAFHAHLPAAAATYPLPARWRRQWGLRRYGFHGLSYAYALRRAANLLDRPADGLHLLLAHLGGGASVCAVRDGRSVDTSMGFTPLDGIPMSKRSGAVDPGMLLWLLEDDRLSLAELADGLNHRAGLLGLSGGLSDDTRDLVAAAPDDPTAALALTVYAHRVRRELAAAATSLDRLDALVFTGEIGWDQPEVRHDVCAGLRLLGVTPPEGGNVPADSVVSPPGAGVPVLVVEPREDLEVAAETLAALR
ncbi:acetate kinase [Plantactinospora sp. WMMC1484]|uniref:acetate kinase n=1 Tax=Plantactinospora sp. WMMC1484 TaxID=3404122 RepID=UPI003BF571A4